MSKRSSRATRGVTAVALAVVVAAGTAPAANVESIHVDAVVSEATNMSVAVAPKTGEIAFDLQGALWTLPAQGGRAQRITDISMESRFPQWSADGQRLVFQCYRDNQWHICAIGRDGRQLEQLTSGASDHREPAFSPDGKRVVFVSDEGGNHDLWDVALDSGAARRLARTEGEEAYPAWSPQGDRLAYAVQGSDGTRLVVRTADGQERVLATLAGPNRLIFLPSWDPTGSSVAYVAYDRSVNASTLQIADSSTGTSQRISDESEDVFATRVSWLDASTIVYGADGGIRKRGLNGGATTRIAFNATLPIERHRYAHRKISAAQQDVRPVQGILRPYVSPDGKRIVFAALSDLWLLELGKPEPRRLTHDTAVEADPAFSPDGQQVVFTSDQREAGTMDLCLLDLRTGRRKLLASPGESVTYPSFSPDGRRVAFLVANSADWHDRYVHILDVESGETRRRPQPLFHPSRPSWSADGKHLALSALKQNAARFRRGLNQLLVIDVADFSGRYYEPVPGRSLGMRGANGPEWSPDGSRLAFVSDGILWSLPVSSSGEPLASPLRLTNIATDSISWTRDGRSIAFVSNGKLQRLNVRNGELTPIPLALTWQQQPPAGRTVIRAGRLFDATSAEYRHNVDIVIDGRRITAVERAREGWKSDVRFIDASKSTVLPGLIESHVHNFPMNGEATGRLFLAFGVTSIREVGTDPYDGLEAKESWASGARPGPRNFYSALLEGGQVYYPLSLAIGSPAHFNLEVERIAALDYDLVKTYDRLPEAQLARVIDFAHARGITVASHDLWPAAAFGADAVEHLSTQDRRDISDRQSLRGQVYGDVIELLRRSGMGITSTAFAYFSVERSAGASAWKPSDLVQLRLLPQRYRRLIDAAHERSASDAARAAQSTRSAVPGALIMKLRENGVRVIPATDGPFFLDGLALIREMIAIHKAGVPMHEVLQATTRSAADLLGVGADLGSVEPGKFADLVILDGDPLATPSDLLNVSMVVKDGSVYAQGDLARRGVNGVSVSRNSPAHTVDELSSAKAIDSSAASGK